MIEAVIFDMDGTLISTEEPIYCTFQQLANEYGTTLSENEYTQFTGHQDECILRYLIHKLGSTSLTVEELYQRKQQIYPDHACHAQPLPGVLTCLDALKPRTHISVATSENKSMALTLLKTTGLLNYFGEGHVSCGDEVLARKPAPDVYHLAISRTSIAQHAICAVEDTNIGLTAAVSAGLSCFAIPTQYSRHHDFSRAHKILTSIDELIAQITRL